MNKKIAAIDIGSNSLHLIIANIDEKGEVQIFKKAKKILRLNSFNKSNTISQEAIHKSITTLNNFKNIAQNYNAEIKAVATSAVREAKNKTEFLKQIYNKTKINIEIINGKKEAELIYSGIRKALSINGQKVLCIDIGGGSTEIIIGENNKIEFAESLNIGAVRLTKMFFHNTIASNNEFKECKKFVINKIRKIIPQIKKYNVTQFIGTSGTIKSIALIKNAIENKEVQVSQLNGFSFSFEELKTIQKEILSAKNFEERKRIKGLEETRADIIYAGIILLTTIFEMLEIKSITISNFSLKEGIIADFYT